MLDHLTTSHYQLPHVILPETHMLTQARNFAMHAHGAQRRASGEPFIEHPSAVAKILSDLGFDNSVIAAAWLHDVVEDTSVPIRQIRYKFGSEIAFLVESVTMPHQPKPHTGCATNSVFSDSMVCYSILRRAIEMDRRVAFLRLADRVHNMRTLHALAQNRQRQIALETSLVYVPLAVSYGAVSVGAELLSLAHMFLPPLVDIARIDHQSAA